MTGQHYLILGYVLGLTVLWGYALSLWLARRGLNRRLESVRRRGVATANPPITLDQR